MTDSELIKETKEIVKSVNKRVETKVGAENAPTYVKKRLDDLKDLTKGRMAGKYTRQELEDMYRDAKYLNRLKGTQNEQLAKVGEKIVEMNDRLNDKQSSRLWEAYEKLVESNGLLEKFKYEILEVADKMVQKGHTSDYIVSKLENMYRTANEEERTEKDVLGVEISFTNKLDEFLRKYK